MTLYRFASTLLVAGLLGVAGVAGAQTAVQKTYIVQLADAPAATYVGRNGVGGRSVVGACRQTLRVPSAVPRQQQRPDRVQRGVCRQPLTRPLRDHHPEFILVR